MEKSAFNFINSPDFYLKLDAFPSTFDPNFHTNVVDRIFFALEFE